MDDLREIWLAIDAALDDDSALRQIAPDVLARTIGAAAAIWIDESLNQLKEV